MLFLIICLVFLIVSVVIFKKANIKSPITKAFALGIALSILVTISLAQNYTQSLIPDVNDGIGISNNLAYWIIGESGWSLTLFENSFNLSTYLSLTMILAYPFIVLLEKKFS